MTARDFVIIAGVPVTAAGVSSGRVPQGSRREKWRTPSYFGQCSKSNLPYIPHYCSPPARVATSI
jgi:hypothetical protein